MAHIYAFVLLLFFQLSATKIDFNLLPPDKDAVRSFSIKFEPTENEYIKYKSIHIGVDTPNVSLINWHTIPKPSEHTDTITKQVRQIFRTPFTVEGSVHVAKEDPEAHLIVGYASNKMEAPEFQTFALYAQQSHTAPESTLHSTEETVGDTDDAHTDEPITCPAPHQTKQSVSDYVQKLIAATTSIWLRLLFALFLGLLMSLTPCIYPMIPITIGILQAHSKKSVVYNFLLSTSYMLGIALMFATIGFIAATTGTLFGSLMNKPIVIIAVVAILLYFALSMFDLYEVSMPRFLVHRRQQSPTGSLLSAFIFGVLSGTIASPCLSPGLAFLLTIVTSIGSALLGFALLFMFGVGMSIPLLLIGTFSGSLKFIPKTGTWMIEVKKLFGILLIALSFYFLSNIMSITLVLWLAATCAIALGVYYILTAPAEKERSTLYLKLLFGIVALSLASYFFYKAIRRTWYPEKPKILVQWRSSYQKALQEALHKKTLLLIDIGAPYCSICKAIERCILNDPIVASNVNRMIPVNIDAAQSPDYEYLNKKFTIIGVPTILIIEPTHEREVYRWGAEIYSQTKQQVVTTINDTLNTHITSLTTQNDS
jgi:thioredoxin:protein disulfide reductase